MSEKNSIKNRVKLFIATLYEQRKTKYYKKVLI